MTDESHMQDVNVQQNMGGEVNYNNPPAVYAQPQASSQAASAAPPDAVGCNLNSMKRVFFSAPGALRAAEWLFAIIAFGAMANQAAMDPNFSVFTSDGTRMTGSGKFVIAMGVLVFIYTMAVLVLNIFDVHSTHSFLLVFELATDALFGLLCFIAGIVAGAHCNDGVSGVKYCDSITWLDGKDYAATNAKAAIAFIFFTAFCLWGSAFFSYRRWRK